MFGSLASACSQHYFNRGSIVVCPRSGSWIVGYDGEVDRGTFVVRSETLCQNEGQALRGIQKNSGTALSTCRVNNVAEMKRWDHRR